MLSFSRILTPAVFLAVALTGCSSAQKGGTPEEGATARPAVGPISSSSSDKDRETYGPPMESTEGEKKFILAFGPGYSRGFAASGVLRALSDMKVEVSRIFAHEASALVAAIHSVSPNENKVEWAFMKLNDAPISRQKSISFSITGPEGKVMDRLTEIFGHRRIEELAPPMAVAHYGEKSQTLTLSTQGEIRSVVRRALGGKEMGLRSVDLQGEHMFGRGRNLVDFIREIRSQESAPVCLVTFNELDPEEKALIESENVLHLLVPLQNFPESEFKKRKEAIFQGRLATQRAKTKIFQAIGRHETSENPQK